MGSGKGGEATERYGECLTRLYRTHSLKLGLERMKALSESFGNPGDSYKTIHVAGTNGKGSVCHKISVSLKLRNYRVGLFTSPHVFSLRERIKVDDECISEEDLVSLVGEVWKKADELDLKPSFFETVTIVAYLFFRAKGVDYAVVETGIGGRLDATNILKKPDLVIITSIGYDHQQLLGTHLSDICEEKIGIIKRSTSVVVGPSVSLYRSLFTRATDLGCTLTVVPPEPRGETFNEENTRIATEALKVLKVDAPSDPILQAVICVKPPLRMQYLASEQLEHVMKKVSPSPGSFTSGASLPLAVILDVGHNETAVDRLCQDVNCFHKGRPIRVCVCATRPRSLAIFQPLVAHFQGLLQVGSGEEKSGTTWSGVPSLPDALLPFRRTISLLRIPIMWTRLPICPPLLRLRLPIFPPPPQDVLYLPSLNDRTYDFAEVAEMLNGDEQISGELRGLLLRSAEKVTGWLAGNPYTRGKAGEGAPKSTIPLIVKNAFLECCKDKSILLICGTFFMFDEVLPVFDIRSDLQDPISMNEPSPM
ncbi:dihydrofolate synthase/folylpolyglutamate synthase [Plasmodium vivax India VII]|uniref:Dihydrofolate synthase/folylpolyglutamate synthase, putative n=5 Tax=Plasmodium vivax TaxID=5855 RepID=A5K2Z0_PLAVS|nr:dihydrofolate synthase/folylpolyglutamate synthase, putative [Plasmodium vivax]KMZ79062.1 dihydrofolate synthase/folylpolyglutamate synthase [Plasmodium vivax India VII]KMZ84971.1 dihydrofolate synthase/folylpolyglutamate synthase [Plasmodium vivax Brazil I]KMZ91432.1 dihydrofolate synthase/folylpolyglutamate synthase [Plasmodium vivax Mauritania I]KMZ97948.1 dihydrofolate synthase/folylpolyglutamate synthase [Plasmodium vivax North Korean]EDL45894.1 dihydrofolate synthase/folylpolyglutamat|eukprot:XP_001615621.1 dihydrofolate synthase/folylpolyglutamate synthase [Plasmodium vivax Sal-1]